MEIINSFLFFVGFVGFVVWFIMTDKYKNMDRYIKNFKNLFAAHPKGPKPVPKNVKSQPFHLNRFKESEIKEHLTYFEEICDFDLERAGSNNSNINFRTPLGMMFLVQKVTNFKDPKSTLNGYSGTVYIVMDKNKSVLGAFKDREEAMSFYYSREDENTKLREITDDLVAVTKQCEQLKDKNEILKKMRADMLKDFE